MRETRLLAVHPAGVVVALLLLLQTLPERRPHRVLRRLPEQVRGEEEAPEPRSQQAKWPRANIGVAAT